MIRDDPETVTVRVNSFGRSGLSTWMTLLTSEEFSGVGNGRLRELQISRGKLSRK